MPKRGEIWLVNFAPTVGAEIKKIRPAVVISSDAVGFPLNLLLPLQTGKNSFRKIFGILKLNPIRLIA